VIGTAHPLVVEALARDGGWIVICQAREDTDADGEIAVHVGMHGDTWGDELRPYLVRGSGDGEPIERLIGSTRDDRWLVALRGGALALFDTAAGTWTALAGADLRDDGVALGPHRAAAMAGARMTYFRDDETIVVRTLATGAERVVKVAGARVWRVEPEASGDLALVYAIRKDTDGDGTLTWPTLQTSLSSRGCRGPVMSYSTGGWSGDTPDELWLDLATGAITPARPASAPAPVAAEEIDLGTYHGRTVLAVDRAGRRLVAPDDRETGMPQGPLRWLAKGAE
jgi:hypothetical protein